MASNILSSRVLQCTLRPYRSWNSVNNVGLRRDPFLTSSTPRHIIYPLKTLVNSCQVNLRTCPFNVVRWQTTNTMNSCGKRFYARKRKLPFEVDIKVPTDTVLFTHSNPQFFKMLSIFGIAQLVFWGQLGLFTLTSLDVIDSDTENTSIDTNSFWGKIIVMQTEYKERIAFGCVSIGLLVAFFTYIYPRRTIQELVLLAGGRNLKLVTYTHFARSRSFTVPVENLSVLAPRAGKSSQVSLRLKDHRFYYLMDKQDGKFHDTKLFDNAVGLRRDIQ